MSEISWAFLLLFGERTPAHHGRGECGSHSNHFLQLWPTTPHFVTYKRLRNVVGVLTVADHPISVQKYSEHNSVQDDAPLNESSGSIRTPEEHSRHSIGAMSGYASVCFHFFDAR